MPKLVPASPITAVVYTDSALAARILDRAANALKDAGHACSGFVQRDEPRSDRRQCDMILIDLVSGERVDISEDRGPGARGCHLRPAALLSAMEAQRAKLSDEVSILILNKFGKIEGEGGGFRPLIADAVDSGVPVLIAVPWRNIEAWREFAGEFAREIDAAACATAFGPGLLAALGLASGSNGSASCNLHKSTPAGLNAADSSEGQIDL